MRTKFEKKNLRRKKFTKKIKKRHLHERTFSPPDNWSISRNRFPGTSVLYLMPDKYGSSLSSSSKSEACPPTMCLTLFVISLYTSPIVSRTWLNIDMKVSNLFFLISANCLAAWRLASLAAFNSIVVVSKRPFVASSCSLARLFGCISSISA